MLSGLLSGFVNMSNPRDGGLLLMLARWCMARWLGCCSMNGAWLLPQEGDMKGVEASCKLEIAQQVGNSCGMANPASHVAQRDCTSE